jgi:hypothetical protein
LRVGTSSGAGDVLDTVRVDVEHYNLTGVSDGKTYYAQLRAVDVAGNVGPWSTPSDGITVDLTAPGSVTVSDEGKWLARTYSTWTWMTATDATSGVLRYHVEVGTSKGSSDVLSDGISLLASLVLTNLVDGKSYYCHVRAQDAAGNLGAWSEWTDGIWVDVTAPTTPSVSDPGVYSTKASIAFTWTASTDATSGVAGYRVYVGTTPSTDDVVSGTMVSGTTYTLPNGQDGVTYYCRVRAVDQAGNVGLFGGPTDGIKVDTVAPVSYAPSDGGDWHNASGMVFTWPPAMEVGTGIAGYYVCVGTAPGASNVVSDFWTTASSYTLAAFTEGSTYYCKIRAMDVAGNVGLYSPSSDGIRVDTKAPSVVYFLPMDEWTSSPIIHFEWITAEDDVSGVMGYEVLVSNGMGHSGTDPSIGFTPNTECVLEGVDGVWFTVTVRAVDVAGNRGALRDSVLHRRHRHAGHYGAARPRPAP